MSFKNLLSPESRRKLEEMRFREAQAKQRLEASTNKELAEKLEHFMKNSFGHQRVAAEYRDSPVYDSAVWYILLPLVIERLKQQDD